MSALTMTAEWPPGRCEDVSYADLAEKPETIGVKDNERSIARAFSGHSTKEANKINR
jgi:hypothetical protein